MKTPWTIKTAAEALRDGSIKSIELLEAGYDQANRLDEELAVYVRRFDATAREAAAQADRDFEQGIDRGSLQGIPIGIKDIIFTREALTSGNSLVTNPAWEVKRDAHVVSRIRAAGAIITGKLSTMEFAFGAVDPGGIFRLPRTPWSIDHWAGGSSSGSGNGIASNMFLGALGTDTGGSVRLPASYCGITGLKQTYGLVSLDGVIPLSTSLDHVGPMARSAADVAALLQVMAGYDASDPTSADVPIGDFSAELGRSLRGLRVGVERGNHFTGPDVDPELREVFEVAVGEFERAGATVTEVELPYYREIVDGTVITFLADAMAYHRRLLAEQWHRYQRNTRLGFAGGVVFSAADLVQATKVRRAVRRMVLQMFDDVDIMLMPTTATAPWPVLSDSEIEQIQVERVIASIYTAYWNAMGNPAVSVPMGFNSSGLPFGLQIAGRPFEDATVIGVADGYQRLTDWHLRVAPCAQSESAEPERSEYVES